MAELKIISMDEVAVEKSRDIGSNIILIYLFEYELWETDYG